MNQHLTHDTNPNGPFIDQSSLRFCFVEKMPFQKLPGFKKHHQVPSSSNTMAEKFVGNLVADELASEFQTLHQFTRQQFGHKRKELVVTIDDNTAVFESPVFVLTKSFELDKDSVEEVTQKITLESVKDLNALVDPHFESGFPYRFTKLEMNLNSKLDIEDVIDAIEDLDDIPFQLNYDFAATSCELIGSSLLTKLNLTADRLCLSSSRNCHPRELITEWLEYEKLLVDVLGK